MRLLFVLFTAVMCSLQVQAQTILAGEHGQDPLYIGVKVFRETDVQYGWIQVADNS